MDLGDDETMLSDAGDPHVVSSDASLAERTFGSLDAALDEFGSPEPGWAALDERLGDDGGAAAAAAAAPGPAPPAAAANLRRGKWTQCECDYAGVVVEHFTAGTLPGLVGGESLRATLSELLSCAPMRITKKLSATRAHGKQTFRKRGELGARERVALEAARAAFLDSLARKPASPLRIPALPVASEPRRVLRPPTARRRRRSRRRRSGLAPRPRTGGSTTCGAASGSTTRAASTRARSAGSSSTARPPSPRGPSRRSPSR